MTVETEVKPATAQDWFTKSRDYYMRSSEVVNQMKKDRVQDELKMIRVRFADEVNGILTHGMHNSTIVHADCVTLRPVSGGGSSNKYFATVFVPSEAGQYNGFYQANGWEFSQQYLGRVYDAQDLKMETFLVSRGVDLAVDAHEMWLGPVYHESFWKFVTTGFYFDKSIHFTGIEDREKYEQCIILEKGIEVLAVPSQLPEPNSMDTLPGTAELLCMAVGRILPGNGVSTGDDSHTLCLAAIATELRRIADKLYESPVSNTLELEARY